MKILSKLRKLFSPEVIEVLEEGSLFSGNLDMEDDTDMSNGEDKKKAQNEAKHPPLKWSRQSGTSQAEKTNQSYRQTSN